MNYGEFSPDETENKMTRTFTVTPEMADFDVCVGDYDGHVSKEVFSLSLFKHGQEVDWCNFYVEEDAISVGERFVATGELI